MPDTMMNPGQNPSGCFKEAVCVSAGRIYDSCSSKDCLEDLRVFFVEAAQTTVSAAQSIKCRRVEVMNVFMDVESVPFNKGFYSVDMTYYFLLTFDTYAGPAAAPVTVQGIASFSKKVILYGSEGSVKRFSSDSAYNSLAAADCLPPSDHPTAKVQVVDPIILACRLSETPSPQGDTTINAPQCILDHLGGNVVTGEVTHYVYVTIGMFSIVQMERDVQMMIPIYDFCMPDKECGGPSGVTDDPCELFRRIKFPVNEFFPPRLAELDSEEPNDNGQLTVEQ